jgi:GNAT superfamily N-acetyltransferase
VTIAFRREDALGPDEFIDVLRRSGLAERRPVADRARIGAMLKNADLIVTARSDSSLLVGVARCLTDFSFCCYVSDLAVDKDWQGKGLGTALLDRCAAEAGELARLFLLSAPGVEGFYERIGMTRHPAAFERPGWRRFSEGGA